ncbi:MAG: endonuclease III [Chloroflexi bacterium]|nr:endonuclease III [Ardenticatenaceae bacterium]MBL1129066.1 endonuclease III [Chloroflexota bacterium]NOG35145.1 endonuclease III [Chloroflexota bacterium]GIK58254.1 MAG: endonuclease III [Chloroflexota bacterium]
MSLNVEQVTTAVTRLRHMYPDAHCELNYETPIQLLAATILSAQCTDERVNQVTPTLFARFPDAPALAAADRAELEEIIRPTGFFRQKAKFIQESAQTIVHEYGGEVPQRMEELLKLNGVARKTANVVLGEIYGRAEGITVDTHVKRIAYRLGWTTTNDDPVKVEQELMALIPQESWIEISHLLIFHGRALCKARRPDCPACPLRDICPEGQRVIG